MLPELTTACPNCAQQPGEECRWAIVHHPRFHFERVVAASELAGMQNAAGSDAAEIPTEAQFDAAVESSGLV